jgi:hypothetical protein
LILENFLENSMQRQLLIFLRIFVLMIIPFINASYGADKVTDEARAEGKTLSVIPVTDSTPNPLREPINDLEGKEQQYTDGTSSTNKKEGCSHWGLARWISGVGEYFCSDYPQKEAIFRKRYQERHDIPVSHDPTPMPGDKLSNCPYAVKDCEEFCCCLPIVCCPFAALLHLCCLPVACCNPSKKEPRLLVISKYPPLDSRPYIMTADDRKAMHESMLARQHSACSAYATCVIGGDCPAKRRP